MASIQKRRKRKIQAHKSQKRLSKDSLHYFFGNGLFERDLNERNEKFLFLKDALNLQILINKND
ncbi:MAG: hypothetical protein AB7I27_18160 [Bacteriovoracaceae bacterium]